MCGKQAFWFTDGGQYHRPLCAGHSEQTQALLKLRQPIGLIDPAKVPQKLPTQEEQARLGDHWIVHEGATVQTTGAQPPFVRNPMFQPLEPVDVPPSVAPPLSRPPLKDALADVALAFLGFVKKKIEEETKR